jgi:hypothetical protein
MKHITIDRVIVLLLTIAMIAIFHRQSSTDQSQDQRTEQFFNELQSAKVQFDSASGLPIDSAELDSID